VKKTLPEPIRHAPISTNEKELMQLRRELGNRKQDAEFKRQELALQAKISADNLRLMQKHHAENVELKLQEIQANYDVQHWKGILSRDETIKILEQGKEENRFLILLSPPDVSPNCPLVFQHDLGMTLRSKVKEFVETYYPPQSDFPVQFFGKFFQSSIFDTEAVQLENLLSAVPTAVIFSDLTNKALLLHIHVWGVMGGKLSLSSSFEWKAEFKKLQAEGKDEEDALDEIEAAIVQTHKLLGGFLSDVYFLQVNPLHEPQLFLIDKVEYPAELTGQLLGQLKQLQQEKRAEYEVLLLERKKEDELRQQRELEEKREAELEQKRQEKLRLKRQKEEEERLRKEEKERLRKEKEERLRIEREGIIIGHFTIRIQNDGIAIDNRTGLMWLRFALGQEWKNGIAEGKEETFTWGAACYVVAKHFNENGGYGGFTDWRLPTIDELKTLIDEEKGKEENYIDADVFPNNCGWFWSSTSKEGYWTTNFWGDIKDYIFPDESWVVSFWRAGAFCDKNNSSHAVRLVRGGQ
jgi:hypothetical protein